MIKKKTPLDTILSASFGFDPVESRHHFLVNIPRGATQEIQISEHFTWSDIEGSSPQTLGTREEGQVRVILARPKWDALAEEVRAEFNQRLKRIGKKAGSWRVGANLVRRELGKELVLLAWAVEEADPGIIRKAIANWKGFFPEERWWLYTQTAAATGHGVNDRGKGWRKALRYALTENPVPIRDSADEPIVPEFFQRARQHGLFEGTPDKKRKKKTAQA